MSITIKHLEAFVQVADLGAFNRAAERLRTTQPNISSRIASLEALLGITLMERDPGSVRLTPQGQDLLTRARRILAAMDDFKIAADNAALIDGVLRLGVTEMIADTWLGSYLKKMHSQYPNIAVELSVDLSVNIERELARRSLDLAFHNAPFMEEGMASVDLGEWPLIWIAAPEVDVPNEKPLPVGALNEQTIITHARGGRLHDEIAAHFAAVGHPSPGLVSSSNLTVCLHLAQAGFGIAAVPRVMAKEALKNRSLVEVPYSWTPDPLHFKARYDETRAPFYIRAVAEIGAEMSRDYHLTNNQ